MTVALKDGLMGETRQRVVEGMKRASFDRLVRVLTITDQVVGDVERRVGVSWESMSLELRVSALADLYAFAMGYQDDKKTRD